MEETIQQIDCIVRLLWMVCVTILDLDNKRNVKHAAELLKSRTRGAWYLFQVMQKTLAILRDLAALPL